MDTEQFGKHIHDLYLEYQKYKNIWNELFKCHGEFHVEIKALYGGVMGLSNDDLNNLITKFYHDKMMELYNELKNYQGVE